MTSSEIVDIVEDIVDKHCKEVPFENTVVDKWGMIEDLMQLIKSLEARHLDEILSLTIRINNIFKYNQTLTSMEKSNVIKILKTHNAWRQGEDTTMVDIAELGKAIDEAVRLLETDHIVETNEMIDQFDPHEALLLAGKLATKAHEFLCAEHFNHSEKAEQLQNALSEYNIYIFKYPVK